MAHGGYETGADVEIAWVDTEKLTESNVAAVLRDADGVLIPGGFGLRGVEGKVAACQYAREHKIPYLGICLGMQVAVIEYARHVLGIADANSSEFFPEGEHSVIDLLPDQYGVKMGGTMRLGAYPCRVIGKQLKAAYGQETVQERHRHRFEFNNEYREALETAGLTIAGTSPDGTLVEAVEVDGNDFFVGVQFHPEFKSRPNAAHPLFREFIRAAVAKSQRK